MKHEMCMFRVNIWSVLFIIFNYSSAGFTKIFLVRYQLLRYPEFKAFMRRCKGLIKLNFIWVQSLP